MRMLNASRRRQCVYLRLLITGAGEKNVKFVMIDEVQDYTETQLMVQRKKVLLACALSAFEF